MPREIEPKDTSRALLSCFSPENRIQFNLEVKI